MKPDELALHCAVMGPSIEKTNDVIKYLVQACPNSLEYKSTLGDTPLWLAFYFGRLEFAKTLIKAGANQMTRNNSGENIIHAAMLGMPRASSLGPVLELVDSGIIAHLFQQRNNIHESGTTPLHSWLTAVCNSRRKSYYYSGTRYDSDEQVIDVLDLLLKLSHGAELEMLNGAGDTPLHTAVMCSDNLLTKALVRYNPKLVYRENAVGRTPAEVARENVTGEKLIAPGPVVNGRSSGKNPTSYINMPVESFVKADDDSSSKLSDKQKVWESIRLFLERYPDKRRLVSLNEANDVAKRLGEKYNGARYFSIRARQDEDADLAENEAGKEDFASMMRTKDSWLTWR
ncbi:ankyrin [Colletotrichum zoysiae]|uniref:Ankyrin n=1 Tax=Colletotrichum zoysiae TaxID=1216348 RepID=A0AAD9HFR0_9PEZI|nr:ankyrin [Colletotrichum zoysiae]